MENRWENARLTINVNAGESWWRGRFDLKNKQTNKSKKNKLESYKA
jgi:hypothetical protein